MFTGVRQAAKLVSPVFWSKPDRLLGLPGLKELRGAFAH